MIYSLELTNFKPFSKQLLRFKNLTVLSGLNSTGKSSVLQSLLLLRQSYQQGLLIKTGLALNGELVSIGTAQDALFEGAKDDFISFELVCNDGLQKESKFKGLWCFNYNREADVIEIDSSLTSTDSEIYQSSLFNDKFCYLQAERLGPRTFFEMSDFQVRHHRQLGSQGEYTAHFLSLNQDEEIPNPKLRHSSENVLDLRQQVEAWMGEISPGTRINIIPNSEMDLINLRYSYELSSPYRSTNVGFGVTYTLPILVAILAAKPGTLILLENPEAHLHPKGQAKIGELMALAASCGVQIIVETHSDHILNGIRLAAYNQKIKAEDVQLYYFRRKLMRDQVLTEVLSPCLYQDGGIDLWPDGFFDQATKDLMEML